MAIKNKQLLINTIIRGVDRSKHFTVDDKSRTTKVLRQEYNYNKLTLAEVKANAKLAQAAVNRRVRTIKKHEAELRQIGYDIHNNLSLGILEKMLPMFKGLNSLGEVTLARLSGETDDKYRNRLIAITNVMSKFYVSSQSSYTNILDFAHKSIAGLAEAANVPVTSIMDTVTKLGFDKYINALQMAKQMAYDVYDSDVSAVVAAVSKAAEQPDPNDPWYGMTFIERLEQAIIDLNRGWTY